MWLGYFRKLHLLWQRHHCVCWCLLNQSLQTQQQHLPSKVFELLVSPVCGKSYINTVDNFCGELMALVVDSNFHADLKSGFSFLSIWVRCWEGFILQKSFDKSTKVNFALIERTRPCTATGSPRKRSKTHQIANFYVLDEIGFQLFCHHWTSHSHYIHWKIHFWRVQHGRQYRVQHQDSMLNRHLSCDQSAVGTSHLRNKLGLPR